MEVIDYFENNSSCCDCKNVTLYAGSRHLKYIVNVFEEAPSDNEATAKIEVYVYEDDRKIIYESEVRSYFILNKVHLISYLDDFIDNLVIKAADKFI